MATRRELEFYIKAKNEAKAALTTATKDVKGFKGALKRTSETLFNVQHNLFSLKKLLIGGIGFAIAKREITDFIRASNEQEKATASFHQALVSTGRYTPQFEKKMLDLAAALQKTTIFGDEVTLSGMKMLATYKDISDKQMPRVIKIMQDLAALTGGDMTSAANILGKASMGLTGELARYGITLSEDVKKSKDFNAILKEIEEQVKGQAEALRNTGYGGLVALKNQFGDIKEKLGDIIKEGIRKYVDEGIEWLRKLNEKLKNHKQQYIDQLRNALDNIIRKGKDIKTQWLPILEGIKKGIHDIYGAYMLLPEWVREIGIIAAIFGGKKWVAIEAGLLFTGKLLGDIAIKIKEINDKPLTEEMEKFQQGYTKFGNTYIKLHQSIPSLTNDMKKQHKALIQSLQETNKSTDGVKKHNKILLDANILTSKSILLLKDETNAKYTLTSAIEDEVHKNIMLSQGWRELKTINPYKQMADEAKKAKDAVRELRKETEVLENVLGALSDLFGGTMRKVYETFQNVMRGIQSINVLAGALGALQAGGGAAGTIGQMAAVPGIPSGGNIFSLFNMGSFVKNFFGNAWNFGSSALWSGMGQATGLATIYGPGTMINTPGIGMTHIPGMQLSTGPISPGVWSTIGNAAGGFGLGMAGSSILSHIFPQISGKYSGVGAGIGAGIAAALGASGPVGILAGLAGHLLGGLFGGGKPPKPKAIIESGRLTFKDLTEKIIWPINTEHLRGKTNNDFRLAVQKGIASTAKGVFQGMAQHFMSTLSTTVAKEFIKRLEKTPISLPRISHQSREHLAEKMQKAIETRVPTEILKQTQDIWADYLNEIGVSAEDIQTHLSEFMNKLQGITSYHQEEDFKKALQSWEDWVTAQEEHFRLLQQYTEEINTVLHPEITALKKRQKEIDEWKENMLDLAEQLGISADQVIEAFDTMTTNLQKSFQGLQIDWTKDVLSKLSETSEIGLRKEVKQWDLDQWYREKSRMIEELYKGTDRYAKALQILNEAYKAGLTEIEKIGQQAKTQIDWTKDVLSKLSETSEIGLRKEVKQWDLDQWYREKSRMIEELYKGTDRYAKALQILNEAYKAGLTEIEKIGQQAKEILIQYKDILSVRQQELQDKASNLHQSVTLRTGNIANISETIASLGTGSLSPYLPAQRWAEAENWYSTLQKEAFKGIDVTKFTSYAQSYLEQARSMWASSSRYTQIYEQVQKDLKRAQTLEERRLQENQAELRKVNSTLDKIKDVLEEIADNPTSMTINIDADANIDEIIDKIRQITKKGVVITS